MLPRAQTLFVRVGVDFIETIMDVVVPGFEPFVFRVVPIVVAIVLP